MSVGQGQQYPSPRSMYVPTSSSGVGASGHALKRARNESHGIADLVYAGSEDQSPRQPHPVTMAHYSSMRAAEQASYPGVHQALTSDILQHMHSSSENSASVMMESPEQGFAHWRMPPQPAQGYQHQFGDDQGETSFHSADAAAAAELTMAATDMLQGQRAEGDGLRKRKTRQGDRVETGAVGVGDSAEEADKARLSRCLWLRQYNRASGMCGLMFIQAVIGALALLILAFAVMHSSPPSAILNR